MAHQDAQTEAHSGIPVAVMRLPYLSYTQNQRLKAIGDFAGLNKNLICNENEFSDMGNISDRFYPAIGSREPRGPVTRTLTNLNGFIYKNGFFWVTGTEAYYNGNLVGYVANSKKQLVGMGAYIVMWPDKKVFNTATGGWRNIEKSFSYTGNVVLKPFSKDSAFTCIYCPGIKTAFSDYDAITIHGITGNYADMNGSHVIQASGTDGTLGEYIVITYAMTMPVDQAATAADIPIAQQEGRTPRTIYATSVTQNITLTADRTAPDMDFICESNNRIWGCSSDNHEIYGSKLGDPTNWQSFEGISTDSYAATVGSDGDFTACIGHMGYVLFFKEHTIHKLFGAKPSNFQLNTNGMSGVRAGCEKSLQIINETLYYVGRDGVYSYDGSTPYLISKAFGQMRLQNAVAGQQDNKLYLSASDGTKHRVYVYDPQTTFWMVESDEQFQYTAFDSSLVYADNAGKVRRIKGGTEMVDWYLESGDIREQSLNNKYISKLLFNFWLATGSVVDVYIKWDDEPLWDHKGQISSDINNTYTLPIIPRRCNKFRYRIEGRGEFKLIALGRYLEDASEVTHGIIKH